MEQTDGDRADEHPFGEELTPAIRRIDDTTPEASIPEVDDLIGPPQTLEPAIQGIWAIRSTVSAIILGTVVGFAFSMVSIGSPWIGGFVMMLGTIIGIVFSMLRYQVWTYQVREDSLYLHRGVLTRVNTVAPFVRIQHVDTRRGPIERIFGLATTVVYTAGSRGADVSIPGLTPERADDLQARLKQLAIVAESEDAV